MKQAEVQHYINNFRRRLAPYLKSDVGIKSSVYPFEGATIIEFEFDVNVANNDLFNKKSNSVLEAVHRAGLDAYPFNNNVVFRGTNYYLIEKKVFLIKDDELKEWSESQVIIDVQKIMS